MLPALLFICISLFAILLVNIDSDNDPNLIPRFLFLSICTVVFWILFMINMYKNPKDYDFSIIKRPVFYIYLAYLLILAVSLLKAINISEVIWEWMKAYVFLVYFVILSIFLSRKTDFNSILSRIIVLFSILILSIGTYEFLLVILTSELKFVTTYEICAGFSFKNIYSQMLLFTLPFTIYGVYKFRGAWKYTCLITGLLVLIFITLLMTRSVWFALVFALVATIFMIFILSKELLISKTVLRKLLFYSVLSILTIIGSVTLYSKFKSIDIYTYRIKEIGNFKDGSASKRLMLWDHSLDMIQANPLLGVGAGNWKLQYMRYAHKMEFSHIGERLPRRPHNDFLWIAAETGVLGLIAYMTIFIVLLYYIFRFIKYSNNSEDRVFVLLMFFALVSYLIFSLFSFPKERIETSILLFIIFSIVLVKYHKTFPLKKPVSVLLLRKISLPALILLIATLIIGIVRLNAQISTDKARTYHSQKKYNNAIREIDNAYSWFSTVDYIGYPLMGIRGMANYELGNYELALFDYKKAYEANPYQISILNNLALTYKKNNYLQNAEKYFLNALEIAPEYKSALLNLCLLYIQSKRINDAYEIIKRYNPNLKNRGYSEMLLAILHYKIKNVITALDDDMLMEVLIRKKGNDKWIINMYKRSIKKNITVEEQFLMRAINILRRVDKSINTEEAMALRRKYNLIK